IGLLTRIPDPRSGIFTSTVRKRDGTTLFQAPTALLGVDINYSVPTTPQLAIVGTPQIWFDVHHLPAA
ncbi:MAG: hypothetical protein Q8Q49_03800, partial [bacterium]|nr:hypothetical protein [bacterium]